MTSDLLEENKDLRKTINKLEKEIGELKYQFHNLAEMDYAHQDRIEELEAQIEKMKCPQNCKNGSVYNWSDNSICMDCEKVRTLHEDNWQKMCKSCKYWEGEIKE